MTRLPLITGTCIALLAALAAPAAAQEVAMFGNTPDRNMVSDETGVVSEWDVDTGRNVLWSQPVGSQAYGGPVVANGRVYVGTNNEGRRDAAIEGDKGVVMAFDAASGDFIWQMVHPKLSSGRVNDWPLQGVCSTAFMVTRPLISGAISMFTRASRARANSNSLTGTSLTTTVYLSSCSRGAGSGTGGGCRTISGIAPDGPVSAATSRCPAEGGGGSGVNFAHEARKVVKTTSRIQCGNPMRPMMLL